MSALKEKATLRIESAIKEPTNDRGIRDALIAQAAATLYAAEQQRIANLIALASDPNMINPLKGSWEDGFWEEARKEIVKGLELA